MSEDRKFNHQESDEQGLGVSMPFRRYRPAWAQGEVMLFEDLSAFFQEHQYCGDLDGGWCRDQSSSGRCLTSVADSTINRPLLDSRQPSKSRCTMRRIGLAVVLSVGLTLTSLSAEGQQPGKVYRVGILTLSAHR
jgi:hypothetical protein